jgi:hypothetical protein
LLAVLRDDMGVGFIHQLSNTDREVMVQVVQMVEHAGEDDGPAFDDSLVARVLDSSREP